MLSYLQHLFSVAASAVPTESPVESTKEYDDIQKDVSGNR